jgi:hypothetical protein
MLHVTFAAMPFCSCSKSSVSFSYSLTGVNCLQSFRLSDLPLYLRLLYPGIIESQPGPAEDDSIMKPVNRISVVPDFRELFPTTRLDRLLSAEDRRLFEHQALPSPPQTIVEAMKELGKFVSETTSRERLLAEYYPVFYRLTRTQLQLGVSHDELQALVTSLAESDVEFVAVVRLAIEDALAGRPSKYE